MSNPLLEKSGTTGNCSVSRYSFFLELAFHSVIGTVACQNDAIPCVLRPLLAATFCVVFSRSDISIY